jgi:two-component system LytT family sensor kinase
LTALKNRLKRIAVITSPIIAAYGVAPIFLLKSVDTIPLIIAFLSLTLLIGFFWWINIFLIAKIISSRARYIISYSATFFLQTLVLTLLPQFPDQQNISDFLFYSISSTVAINTIILIIINSELLKRNKDLADFEIQNLKVANLEAQKQVLLQQLQPHFLFNALSTLKSLINENPEKAEEYSIHLSEFLRYSVHANQNDLVNLERECEFTKDFLNLQQVRFGNALQWTINIDQSEYQKFIPVLSLQTVVENAIKHNAFTEKKPLNISIVSTDSKLIVRNDKSPKPISIKSGIGLKNLSERYNFFTNNGLEFEEDENSFTVHLKLIEK